MGNDFRKVIAAHSKLAQRAQPQRFRPFSQQGNQSFQRLALA